MLSTTPLARIEACFARIAQRSSSLSGLDIQRAVKWLDQLPVETILRVLNEQAAKRQELPRDLRFAERAIQAAVEQRRRTHVGLHRPQSGSSHKTKDKPQHNTILARARARLQHQRTQNLGARLLREDVLIALSDELSQSERQALERESHRGLRPEMSERVRSIHLRARYEILLSDHLAIDIDKELARANADQGERHED